MNIDIKREYLLAFDNKECFLIDFVLYVNIAGNLSYFNIKIEKDFSTDLKGRCWFSQTFELIMSCSILTNFVMLSNCFHCIGSHLICLGLITLFFSLFLSLEGYVWFPKNVRKSKFGGKMEGKKKLRKWI